MTRRQIVAGVSGAAAGVLLSLPVYAYQGVPENGGVNGQNGGVNGQTGGVESAQSASALPNTSANPAGLNVTGLVIAGAAAGGSLIVLAGLGMARRRRTF